MAMCGFNQVLPYAGAIDDQAVFLADASEVQICLNSLIRQELIDIIDILMIIQFRRNLFNFRFSISFASY